MKVFVSTGMIGSFAFDKDGNLVHYVLFRQDPALIAERVESARKGEITPEEEELLRDLIRSGYKQVAWDKKADFPGMTCMYEPENPAKVALQRDMRKLAIDLQFAKGDAELNKLLSEVSVLLTKKQLRKERKDAILMRAVSVADELDRTLNTLSELMREWYGLYFPEAERLIRDHGQLAKTIHEEGEREKVTDKKVEKYASMTAGMPFSQDDISAIQEYAKAIAGLYALRDSHVSYIRKTSKAYMPNLTAVAGPLIACRLLLLAGGLERLAKLPSSTMQLLGAEKALFRHLKSSKDRPPKFGVIFAHPLIQGAHSDDKGKVARLLAAKLVMAARADFYTGKDMSEKLVFDLNAKTAAAAAQPHKSGAQKSQQNYTPYTPRPASNRPAFSKPSFRPRPGRDERKEGRPSFGPRPGGYGQRSQGKPPFRSQPYGERREGSAGKPPFRSRPGGYGQKKPGKPGFRGPPNRRR